MTNQGKGAALKTGFQSIPNDTDIIVTIDGDGQHNPEDIPRLIQPILDGKADIVNGSRYLEKTDNETPIYRRLGQTVLDTATNLNSGLNLTDSQSGLRAFASYTLPAFKFNQDGFSIESGMLIDAANSGYRITEVNTRVKYQNGNNIHKKNPLSHGLGVLINIIRDMGLNRPLYYLTIPGVTLITLSLIAGLIFFGAYLDQQMASLLPTVLAALIGLAGLFIAFTGVLLHFITHVINKNNNNELVNKNFNNKDEIHHKNFNLTSK